MSAYAAITHRDRVEIITDGAQYTPDGILVNTTNKVSWVPGRPIAITGRGNCRTLEFVEEIVCEAFEDATFDEGIAALAETVPGIEGMHNWYFETIVAGISEKDGPTIWHVSSNEWEGLPAYTLTRIENGIMSNCPFTADQYAEIVAKGGLQKFGIGLMEHVRRQAIPAFDDPEAPPGYYVGAHIDHVAIRPSGVTRRRIHEWNDTIGETINPFADAGNIVPMNRKQRLAAKREQMRQRKQGLVA